MFDSVWLLFAFPALGALLILFVGQRLSQKVVGWLAAAAPARSFVVLGITFLQTLKAPGEH